MRLLLVGRVLLLNGGPVCVGLPDVFCGIGSPLVEIFLVPDQVVENFPVPDHVELAVNNSP